MEQKYKSQNTFFRNRALLSLDALLSLYSEEWPTNLVVLTVSHLSLSGLLSTSHVRMT